MGLGVESSSGGQAQKSPSLGLERYRVDKHRSGQVQEWKGVSVSGEKTDVQ
jgi:hypothetical protein